MISPSMDRDVLYQVSAMDLLMNGSYGGITSAKDLKAHGDFGIGTFEGLDGEMIVLDGTVYQARSDGVVRAMDDSASIPFAEVTYFDADRNIALRGHYNYSTITSAIDEKLSSKNDFYAVRIHTTFTYLKVRSPPAQHEPYPALSEALKNQSVFELNNDGWPRHSLSTTAARGKPGNCMPPGGTVRGRCASACSPLRSCFSKRSGGHHR
jgi:acetolactate decarboxylase